MKNIENKNTVANNIKYQMALKRVTNKEVCKDLNFKYTTFLDWINGKTFPRIDKIELMANYFGCLKSDLIEEQTEEMRAQKKDNKVIADLAIRMQNDKPFFEAVKAINEMEPEKLSSLLLLLK